MTAGIARNRGVLRCLLALISLFAMTGVLPGFPVLLDAMTLARIAIARGEFVQADVLLASALKTKPDDAELRFLAARTARRADRMDAAEKHLKECERLKVDAARIDLERKLIRAQNGDLDAVEKELHQAILKDHPDRFLMFEALGIGYVKEYRITDALQCMTFWLEQQPDWAPALHQRAAVWDLISQPERALEDYRRVVELAPDRFDARLRLAVLLEAAGKDAEALEHFEALRATRPKDAQVQLGLARCLNAQGKVAEATKLVDALLERNADNTDVLLVRARIDIQNGEPAKAEARLRRAVALSPSSHLALYLLYMCSKQLGREEEGKEFRKQLELLDQDLKRLEEVKKQIMSKPADVDARVEAGTLLMRFKQETDGVHFLESALRIDPRHRAAHAALADYYERAGKKELAGEHRRLAKPMEK